MIYYFNEDENFIKNLKIKYKIPENINQIILYCPTFREDHTLKFSISKKELHELDTMLKDMKTLFLLKGHYFVQNVNFKEYENLKLVPKSADIQELYIITDILITDYSSTMLDFSLLNRPILLFPYDLERYKKVRGMYYELEDIAPGPLLYNFKDLTNAIKNIENITKDFEQKRKQVRDRFNRYTDGNSIRRILDFLEIEY